MTDLENMGTRFSVAIIGKPDIPNVAVKVGLWLIGAASLAGGFPVEVSMRDIEKGFKSSDDVEIAGTGNHSSSIRTALEWLEENDFIRTEEGRDVGFGHRAKKIWMEI